MTKPAYEVLSPQGLHDFLLNAGFDVKSWGVGPTKTYDELYKEIEDGESELIPPESELEHDEFGDVIRSTNVLGIDVYTIQDGVLYHLREDKQVFKDGRGERKRQLQSSIGEKIKKDENHDEAVLRAIEEELGITDIELVISRGTSEIWKHTPTYPGLPSKLTIHSYMVMISPNAFVPEGYVEDQPMKKNYFVWDNVSTNENKD